MAIRYANIDNIYVLEEMISPYSRKNMTMYFAKYENLSKFLGIKLEESKGDYYRLYKTYIIEVEYTHRICLQAQDNDKAIEENRTGDVIWIT